MTGRRATASSPRSACIDVGSNTTRLLVAELVGDVLCEVHQERVFTRLGQDVTETGAISPATLAEVAATVTGQCAVARRHGAERVHAVATAAIRVAANAAELLDEVARRSGVAVRVLSGEEEARLAFVGAAGMLEPGGPLGPGGMLEPGGPLGPGGQHRPDRGLGAAGALLGVVDVGGGSCELVVGSAPGTVHWWVSVPIGSGSLTRRCLLGDPPTAGELASAREAVAEAFAGLAPPRPDVAVAVGGGAASLARVAGRRLNAAGLDRWLALLGSQPSASVARRFGIAPERARLLAGALVILGQAATVLDGELTFGRGGIREGVLLEGLPAPA